MLHDRRKRERKRLRKLADRNAIALAELREQGAPRGIGQRGEGAVERGVLILNHVVKYRGGSPARQSGPSPGRRVAGSFPENCRSSAARRDLCPSTRPWPGDIRGQVEGVETAIKAIGCTVEESDITAKGDGYKADDVECKDSQYDMLLDKDFKITKKTKED